MPRFLSTPITIVVIQKQPTVISHWMRSALLNPIQHDECSTFFFFVGYTIYLLLNCRMDERNLIESKGKETWVKEKIEEDDSMFRHWRIKIRMCKEKTLHIFYDTLRLFVVVAVRSFGWTRKRVGETNDEHKWRKQPKD